MVNDGGNQQGPCSLNDLKQMIAKGQLSSNAVVWSPGMSGWQPWQQTREFGSLSLGGGNRADVPRGRSSPAKDGKGDMHDFLLFRRMITPLIIQIIFWIGIGCVVIAAISALASAAGTFGKLGVVLGLLGGAVVLVAGAIGIRVSCELTILAFRINETLTEMKNLLENK
jgi:hypothetical protein